MKSKVPNITIRWWTVVLTITLATLVHSDQLNYRLDAGNGSCGSLQVTIERNHTVEDEESEMPQRFYAKPTISDRSYLAHSSILYNFLLLIDANADQTMVNSRCFDDMQALLDGIMEKRVWAMKALDSSATITSGFILGNNHWLGSQKGCESAQQPLSLAMSDRYHRIMLPDLIQSVAPFDLEYRLVYARHSSKWQIDFKVLAEHILHIGLCVPATCTKAELFNLTVTFFDEKAQHTILNEYDLNAQVLEVKDFKIRNGFFLKKTVIMVGVVMLITCVMCLLASSVGVMNDDVASNNNQAKPDRPVHSPANAETNTDTAATPTTTTFQRNFAAKTESDLVEKVVQCFSVSRNFNWICDTTSPANAIPVINGMKTIACFMILAFHVHWFMYFALHNPYVLIHYAEKFTFQLIANAPLMVDLFFAVSAFLMALSFLKNQRQMAEIKGNGMMANFRLFGKLLLQRYIRLTPTYLFVGLMGEILTTIIVDTSKFWVHERSDLNCQRYWWRNLLYIQNFFPLDELCLNWSWSMSCEMQYYIIFSIILFIYAKNNKIGENVFKYFAAIMFLASSTLVLNISPLPTFDILYQTGEWLYLNPVVRMAPYFPGVFAAWYLTKTNYTLPISKKVGQYLWMLCGASFLVMLNCTVERQMPIWLSNMLFIFVRYVCGVICMWPVVASSSGHGNWVSDLLSMKIFTHLNKLTYTIYLLNPLVITVIYGMSETSAHSDPVLGFVMTIGVTIISYVLAVVLSTLFEMPYCRLCSVLLKNQTNKVKSSTD